MSLSDQPFDLLWAQERQQSERHPDNVAVSSAIKKSSRRALDGQLLPLAQGYLLLPQASVLGTLAISDVGVSTAGPGWLLGFVERQGAEIPVISFEAMTGATVPARSPRTQLSVVNSIGGSLDNSQFAVVTQGYAHRLPLTPRVLKKRPAPEAGMALAQVGIANREAFIPDLEGIEQRLSAAMARIA